MYFSGIAMNSRSRYEMPSRMALVRQAKKSDMGMNANV
jgi:hypothetical protein